MLPDAPALASRALAPAGGSVVLVGVTCDVCDDPELVAFKLSSQRDRWTPLDMPVIDLPRDSMVELVGATPGLAVFDTGAGLVSVAGDGVVDLLSVDPATPADRSWLCVAPGQETLYRVNAPVGGSGGGSPGVVIGSIRFGTPTVTSLDLADTDADWVTEPAPPTPTTTASLESLCTMDGVLVIADGSEYELADGAWSVTPDVPVLVSLGTDSLRAATAATTKDGSIVAVRQHQSGVVRRSAEGEWTDTGVEGTAATAVASGAFVADCRSDTVRFIAAG